MLWVAALLALIVWVLSWQSNFLGIWAHIFLLLAVLAVLGALLPKRLAESARDDETVDPPSGDAESPADSPDQPTIAQ